MVKKCKIPFKSFRYQDFEDVFLEQCKKIDIGSILIDKEDARTEKINNAKNRILVFEDDIKTSQKKVENYEKAIALADSINEDTIKHFAQKINDELQYQKLIEGESKRQKARIAILSSIEKEVTETIANTKMLLKEINKKSDRDRIAIRHRLQLQIKNLVEKIDFFPAGISGENKNKQSKKERCVVVYFKGGGELHFKNDPQDGTLISTFK